MPRFDVTIAGELNLDLILYGLPDELPRERESLADRMMLTLGSSSAIVAHNLAALGVRVGFISCIGDDPLGQIALDRLAASGAFRVNVVDSIGAGDSFDAGFLHECLRGADLPTCLAAGNLAGAFSTTRPGGTEAFRDREYRQQFFRANALDVKS
jgi:sugar/nucleoside kinase (ribokinase family)